MNQVVQLQVTAQHPRILSALDKVPRLLTSGEAVACIVVQLRYPAYSALSRRQIVVATNQRLIILKRGLFGGFDMVDVQWQDLIDAQVQEQSFAETQGCVFKANTRRGRFTVPGLPSTHAFALYRICQEREQEWREKNRIREMEEARAKAGGVSVTPGGRLAGAGTGAGDLMTHLHQLQQMRQLGTISDVEFEAMKAKVLAGM